MELYSKLSYFIHEFRIKAEYFMRILFDVIQNHPAILKVPF